MVNVDTPTAGPPRRASGRDGRSAAGAAAGSAPSIANVVGILFALIMAFPAYWMINTAFKPPNEVLTFTPHFLPENPTFDNFISALQAPLFLDVHGATA